MKKSHSSPILSSLDRMDPRTPPNSRRVSNAYSTHMHMHMRKSVSAGALPDAVPVSALLPLPSTAIEQIGFSSLMKMSPATTLECAINYQTFDFPKSIIESSRDGDDMDMDMDMGLAACVATPSDPPDGARSPVYRSASVGRWLEFCTTNDKFADRFHNLRKRLRKRMLT
jgi:hypothetical protein